VPYDVSTPDEYLSVPDDDGRRDTLLSLLSLRELTERNAPALDESIRCKMLSYDAAPGPVFALDAQKGYARFSVGNAEQWFRPESSWVGWATGRGAFARRAIDREPSVSRAISTLWSARGERPPTCRRCAGAGPPAGIPTA
jgi:hypothetical protein